MSAEDTKFINPLTDFGFKKLFGTEVNKSLLVDFLNEILPKQHKIVDLTYSNNENIGQTIIDRKAIFDLHCKGINGETFIVEIQKAKQKFFKDRSVYYSSFPIQQQAPTGNWDYELRAVYTVGILDFKFDEHKKNRDIIHLVELKNQKCEVFYDKLKFIYIELPKFVKTEKELETRIDKWLYIFRHLSNLQNRPEKLQERIFQQLFKAAEIANFTIKEKEEYRESLKNYMDIKNVVDTSKEERSIEIAENLLNKKMKIEDIAEATNLTIEIVKEIKKRLEEDGEQGT